MPEPRLPADPRPTEPRPADPRPADPPGSIGSEVTALGESLGSVVGGVVGGAVGVAVESAAAVARGLTGRRTRIVEPRAARTGRPPGHFLPPSAPAAPARMTAFHVTPEGYTESEGLTPADALALARAPGVAWINVDGVADTATVAAFGAAFGLHPLVVEDIVHTTQRPKAEAIEAADGSAQVFVTVRMIRATDALPEAAYCTPEAPAAGHVVEQISLVLGPGYVLSFQEQPGDVFDAVRHRLRAGAGRMRTGGADYLVYALLDLVVDHTFGVLERIGDATETLEARAVEDPTPAVQQALSGLRREVVVLRRAVWPLRDVASVLLRDDTPHVEDTTRPYLRDLYDHAVQAIDALEALRDVLGTVSDLYLSAVSTRQNEVMKTLTVVGSIFLPLTFIVGIYGMNFEYMPELYTRNGYFVLLGFMAMLAIGTLAYFRRRGWI